MKSNLEYEHVEMRKLLDKLRLYKDLTFRSEKVPVLLSDFLEQVCAHFKSERRELLTVLESQADKEAYDTHYLSVLEEISEIQFGLIRNQDMSVGSVLPRMEDWVATHEHLHSRACKNFCVNGHPAGNCRIARSDDDRRKESSTQGVVGQPVG